jgi:hypothetical protein
LIFKIFGVVVTRAVMAMSGSVASGNDQALKTWNPNLLRIPEAKVVQKIAQKYCGSCAKSCAKKLYKT